MQHQCWLRRKPLRGCPGLVRYLVLDEKEMGVAITASEARRALFPLIQQVNDDRAPIEITSKRGNAVLMSADDYAAWQETAYLFRSPANARRLLDAAEAAERGETAEHQLDRA
ncbi:MAG TPA: type II toxin-antitoxin system prevent-host-death family antitoxin [Solirubrobacteraceae bacterium]|nr:type II toxin-antitoxin system prevent-host-death family antitoxin [Solirubrobacteraceae bacterium]